MAKDLPEEGELVLCTVDKIMGTTVFVVIDDYNKEGVIATSEVAPGRIRNIRDYVTPHKKIVCKVLRVNAAKCHIDLSLRRVSQKDAREILDIYKEQQAGIVILKIVLKEKAQQALDRISKKYKLSKFFEEAKDNPTILNEFFSENEAKQIINLIKERIKEKIYTMKSILSINVPTSNGISTIKSALLAAKDVHISYLGAPNYLVSSSDKDPKNADKKLKAAIEIITDRIKTSGGKVECKEE